MSEPDEIVVNLDREERWPDYTVSRVEADGLDDRAEVWVKVPAELVARHEQALDAYNKVQNELADYFDDADAVHVEDEGRRYAAKHEVEHIKRQGWGAW